MYSSIPQLILGFHGCDKQLRDDVLLGKTSLRYSQNDYDWLGNGIYFWENNPNRALSYAKFIKNNPGRCKSKIKNPAVIGAIIDPGNCLNLLEEKSLQIVKQSYESLVKLTESAGAPLPENKKIADEDDLLLRKLDCAVIQLAHELNENGDGPEFSSVRGVFKEGCDLYPNAGFSEKDHIQICVRNSNCIKGYFLPRRSLEKSSIA